MSDFHAAWANQNVKAARLHAESIEAAALEKLERVAKAGRTPVEPLEVPMGQGMSQDRQDTDETGDVTKPCNSQLPPHGVRIVP